MDVSAGPHADVCRLAEPRYRRSAPPRRSAFRAPRRLTDRPRFRGWAAMKALPLLLLCVITGCASPSDKVHRMYTALREDARVASPDETAERAMAERQHERVLTMRELVAKGPFAE